MSEKLAMLLGYFDYIFVHLRQKARLRSELNPKVCQLYTRTRPEKPGPTYKSVLNENIQVII